ncbi:MAG: glycosyltransferase family 2 protein [Prevotella sp.]|jgi:glycosyltransferase involved in cell wall biosynthesis|nr:glycosyltransferase family 2 protein [Prevotella sp.]
MIKLGIVSPCYNEEEVLASTVSRLTELYNNLIAKGKISKDSLIVFVNDGSKDKTWEIIKSFYQRNPFVRGIDLANNVGHQNAIMAGMMTAKEWVDGVITIDADLQDDINAIETMIENYEQGYDIVYGVKVSRTADPVLKRFTAQVFYKIQQNMGIEMVFNHADFRFMSKKALDILEGYKERNLYLRGIIPMIGLNATTVEDVISERTAGASKYTVKKMLHLALDGITSFSIKPIYNIVYLGIIFLFISFCIGIYVIHAIIAGTSVPGWSSLILSVWFVGGFILICIGIIGVYIGKIYNEVKMRPLYNIKDVLE